MKVNTPFTKLVRTGIVAASLSIAFAVGGVMAQEDARGLLECDHACKVETLTGADRPQARYQTFDTPRPSISALISEGPGHIGFTR